MNVPAKRNLPNIDELYADVELAAKQNELNRLLNCEPKKEWVQEHPFAKGVKYIPIGVVEYLLTSIFLKWRAEIKETKIIANSVQVTVRLHVQDPLTGEWDWQDGVGAAPIQTAKGAAATDFTQVLTDAVVKATPAAKSYAIKDAAECFGRIFGKDLNRKDTLAYTGIDGRLAKDKIQATPDMVFYLKGLLYNSTLGHDDVDLIAEKFETGITLEEYEAIKNNLLSHQKNPLVDLREGRNMSMKDLNQAVRQRTEMED